MEIGSQTTLRRTCYFNTRQLPHRSVVTGDCEPRYLQVPATISSTAEPRTTESGRSRITTGSREGNVRIPLIDQQKGQAYKFAWKLANQFNRQKNKQTNKQTKTITTTKTTKQNQGNRVNNKDISKVTYLNLSFFPKDD